MQLMRSVIGIFTVLALWATTSSAALVTVYDNGATESLAPYLESIDARQVETQNPMRPSPDLGAADLSRLLPIRTPRLTPGPVAPRPLNLPNGATLPRPLFLIGADRLSREWLMTHRERLVAIQAIGMLVHAETPADLEAIAMLAQDLPILPASANDIAESLDLDHIPVLISRHGIEQ